MMKFKGQISLVWFHHNFEPSPQQCVASSPAFHEEREGGGGGGLSIYQTVAVN